MPTNEGPADAFEPHLVAVDPATTAVIRRTVPMTELPAFFDQSFGSLPEAITSQGIGITGPAFALHHKMPAESADLEVGFVVDSAIQPQGDVVAGSLPGGRVARLVHAGAFDGLGGSWERLHAWIRDQGLTPGPVFWEVYLTEPTPDMDPADLRTELNQPLSD